MDEKLVRECLRMMREREQYYKQATSIPYGRCAHNVWASAKALLKCAINGDADTLAEMEKDFIGEDN